jgi:hypothetical protein
MIMPASVSMTAHPSASTGRRVQALSTARKNPRRCAAGSAESSSITVG